MYDLVLMYSLALRSSTLKFLSINLEPTHTHELRGTGAFYTRYEPCIRLYADICTATIDDHI